jgi:hypothetical protein
VYHSVLALALLCIYEVTLTSLRLTVDTEPTMLQLAVVALSAVAKAGGGCQVSLEEWCPEVYNKGHVKYRQACLACVKAEWPKLQANCSTLNKAESKCGGEGPAPPPPPTPPSPPLPPPSPDEPLTVAQVVQRLGVGLDSSWTKFGSEVSDPWR